MKSMRSLKIQKITLGLMAVGLCLGVGCGPSGYQMGKHGKTTFVDEVVSGASPQLPTGVREVKKPEKFVPTEFVHSVVVGGPGEEKDPYKMLDDMGFENTLLFVDFDTKKIQYKFSMGSESYSLQGHLNGNGRGILKSDQIDSIKVFSSCLMSRGCNPMILNVLFRNSKDQKVYSAQFEVGFNPHEKKNSSGKGFKDKVGGGGSASSEDRVSSHVMKKKAKLTRPPVSENKSEGEQQEENVVFYDSWENHTGGHPSLVVVPPIPLSEALELCGDRISKKECLIDTKVTFTRDPEALSQDHNQGEEESKQEEKSGADSSENASPPLPPKQPVSLGVDEISYRESQLKHSLLHPENLFPLALKAPPYARGYYGYDVKSKTYGSLDYGVINPALTKDPQADFVVHSEGCGYNYGSGMTTELLKSVSRRMRDNDEPYQLNINHISKKAGGLLRFCNPVKGNKRNRHQFHQNGLEVDISYLHTPQKKSFPRMVHKGANKKTYMDPAFDYEGHLKTFSHFVRNQVRAAKGWTSVVNRIFVHSTVYDGLCQWAEKKGELEEYRDVLDRLHPTCAGHTSHWHLRFICSPFHEYCKNEEFISQNCEPLRCSSSKQKRK